MAKVNQLRMSHVNRRFSSSRHTVECSAVLVDCFSTVTFSYMTLNLTMLICKLQIFPEIVIIQFISHAQRLLCRKPVICIREINTAHFPNFIRQR